MATAWDSMAKTTVEPVPLASISMPAPDVELPVMVPKSTQTNDIFPIVTPFHYWVSEEMLENVGTLEDYKDIPAGIKNGYLIGLE